MTDPDPEVVEAELVEDDAGPGPAPAEEDQPEAALAAEVVSPGRSVAVPDEHSPASAAIVAAAEAAVMSPGIPGRDEFLVLAAQARMLSLSGAAPKLVQENVHIAFHVAMVGRDLGLSPSSAIELIDVIDGSKGPTLSLSPQLLNGQVRRLGLGSIVPAYRGEDRAVAWALGPRGADPACLKACATKQAPVHVDDCTCDLLGSSEFTWEDARMAGLVGEGCIPGNHNVTERPGRNGGTYSRCDCNQGYITYPKRMLWWRASGFCADDYFPEASLGLYSAEALGAAVDHEGRAIDVASVELPEGYDAPALPPAKAGVAAARAQETTAADPEALADLKARIGALPDDLKAQMKAKWAEADRLRPYKVDTLPAASLTLARAMLGGFESMARKRGDLGEPVAAPVAPAASGDAAGPEGAGDPPAGAEAVEQPSLDDAAPAVAEGSPADQDPPADQDHPAADDEPPAEKPKPDPEVASWVRAVAAEATAADIDVDALVAEVKALHHSKVNEALADLGGSTDGHIDTRRMTLTAARLEALLHPTWCKALRCDEDRAEGTEWCSLHEPF